MCQHQSLLRHRGRSPCRLAAEAAAKAKDGHYQVACARTFEGLFGEAPEAGVTHPNTFFAESLDISNRGAAGAPGGAATPAAAAGAAATPSTGMQTPAGLPYISTPLQPTPGTGAMTPTLPLAAAGGGAAEGAPPVTPVGAAETARAAPAPLALSPVGPDAAG